MQNPKDLFNAAVAYTREHGTTLRQRGVQPIRVDERAEYRQQPTIPRRLHLVDARLQTTFRLLVSGEFRWPLFLFGPVGSGKTLAALSLCDHVHGSYYTRVEWVATAIMNNDVPVIEDYRLAVLDELGARQKDLDLHYQAIQSFADRREKQNRVAIYVSNLTPQELVDVYDDRIGSRLLCGTRHELAGEDRRRE